MRQDPEKEKDKKKSKREKNEKKIEKFNLRQKRKMEDSTKMNKRGGKSTLRKVKIKFKYGGTKRFDLGGRMKKGKSYK